MRIMISLLVAVAVSACTSVKVKPVDSSLNVNHVCIQHNNAVTMRGFSPMLQEGFARHGISTDVFYGPQPSRCEYILNYTALRSWDVTTYLSHAELSLSRYGEQVAFAEYHLRGKGGFALNKWQKVQTKMDPVIDQLLAGYERDPNATHSPVTPQVANAVPVVNQQIETGNSTSAYAELEQLDKLLSRGIITQAEFDEEKRQILAAN